MLKYTTTVALDFSNLKRWSRAKYWGAATLAALLGGCGGTVDPSSSQAPSSSSAPAPISSTPSSSSQAVSSSSASSEVASSSSTPASSAPAELPPNETVLAADNYNMAYRAPAAPVIDGEIDNAWNAAPWMEMSVAWTGFENLTAPSSAADFSGKYKAIWTEEHLYLLFDITDDVINTDGQYWQQDTVEIFIDEDQSGGPHDNNHNAFAYHISHNLYIMDNGGDQETIASHIDVAINSQATRHIWEIQMEIYAEHNGYVLAEQEAARVSLSAGKVMGFSPSYIDNDGAGTREHFMSSVNTEGHQNNQGYLNADSFGTLELVE